ncbi:MAG: trehalose-6-phosphate synthase, partial [Planctomycetota bacterium]
MASGSRLIVVANRLPIHRLRRGGEYVWETSPGGLVSALTPLLSEFEGYWVGWAGISGKVDTPRKQVGIALENVELSSSDIEDFYRGFSNSTLWPLYHDAVRQPEFHRRWWWPYVDVNRRFAETVAKVTRPGDLVWVHDYQLQLVPGFLRKLCPHTKIGFFLHIPFPPTELFAQLPWRRQLLEGLLGSDLIGFQTRFGGQNFSRCARRFTDVHGTHNQLHWNGRRVRVEPFPISIDFHKYVNIASMPDLQSKARKIKTQFGTRSIILGVDRLDYTKGIDIRLKAFETLLRRREDLVDKVVFVQIAVPSREHVGGYSSLRTSIEQLVGH